MPLKFLSSAQVLEIHEEILKYSGGLPGDSANMPLDSVLGRIENNYLYNGIDNVLQIAALYGVSIAQDIHFWMAINELPWFNDCFFKS